MLPLRVSSPQEEGTLHVSKALKVQMLLDSSEMHALFEHLGSFSIFIVSDVVTPDEMRLAQSDFLTIYEKYVRTLKEGNIPDPRLFKRPFSSVFSAQDDMLYAMQVGENRFLVKPIKPIIQLQLHHFFVSNVDGAFHPMTMGEESISWGLQFSYPQIYQDPKTQELAKIPNTPEFPNGALFLQLMRWVRRETVPTPFLQKGNRVNVPIRLGKRCFDWINAHPQLHLHQLEVMQVCHD